MVTIDKLRKHAKTVVAVEKEYFFNYRQFGETKVTHNFDLLKNATAVEWVDANFNYIVNAPDRQFHHWTDFQVSPFVLRDKDSLKFIREYAFGQLRRDLYPKYKDYEFVWKELSLTEKENGSL